MTKVYLVSTGSYSETLTDSIHSTMELAEARVKQLEKESSNSQVNDIEEWDLDVVHPSKEPNYYLSIDNNGFISGRGHYSYLTFPSFANTITPINKTSAFYGEPEQYKITVHSTSYELAEKIAIELKQAFVLVRAEHPNLPMLKLAGLIGLQYRD